MRFLQDTSERGIVEILDRLKPVGSVEILAIDTDPAALFGFGTWIAFGVGRVLVGLDPAQPEFDALLETGGAKEITLTVAQMPSHTHVQNAHSHAQQVNSTATGPISGYTADTSTNNPVASGISTAQTTAVNQNAGGDQPHPNLPPYVVVRMWRRTA